MLIWNAFHSRCFARPVVVTLAVLSVMGGGLTAGAQATDSHQENDITSYSQINGGGGQPPVAGEGLTAPTAMPSPTATPQSPAAATQATTAAASPTPLATPNPLTTRQATAAANTGKPASGPQARTGSHTVTFTSQPDTQGMPASQTIPDGKTATWPHDDPTRPGWTFNGWFQGDTAYDFTRPVTQDLTLTAKWGKWNTGPDKGPWHGGTNVKIDTPGSQVRLAQVTLGDNYCLGLGSDGNAYAWGQDQEGRMGMGGDQSRDLADARMITMPEGVKFTQVAAGSYAHSMALDRDGRVWTWGSSSGGVLGRPISGGSVNDSNPGLISVPEGVKFTQVAAGGGYSMALDQDGKVWIWGINSLFKDKPGTLDLPAAIAISAKMSYGIALAADGTVWTWGEQTGRATYNLNPHLVDTDTRFTAISVGWIGFIAIARDRTVWTWMDTFDRDFNHANDLRIAIISLGRTIDDKNPADRPGQVPGLTGAFQLGASTQNAVITDTGVWAWGFNREGQLGNGTTNRDPTESVITRFANPNGTPADFHYVNVALDYSHAALIGSDGEVYTCGRNDHGELGTGTILTYGIRFPLPIKAWHPVDRDLMKVLFGEARNIGGPYRAFDGWHATSPRHKLGTVTLTIQYTYKGIPQPDETSHRFTYTGDTATVTFKSEHGSPVPSQQVIVGDTARRPDDPATDDGWTFNGWFQDDKPYDFTQPISGDTTLTARWGRWKADPAQGPWRGGTDVRIDTPTAPVRFTQVSAGQSHSLAVGSDGNLYAWGNNTNGQLGNGTTTNQTTATKATTPTGTGTGFIQTAAGGSHSMALDRDGNIWTWGNNSKGQLGRTPDDNNPADRPGPAATPAGVAFIAISAGTDHSMAIDNEGNTWTWGDNQYQQLGHDTGFGKPTATPTGVGVPEATFASVSAGTRHSIGLDIKGTAWTWGGSNTRGTTSDNDLLGHDNPWNKPWNESWVVYVYVNYAPTAITETRFRAVSAGNDHSAGIARDGTVYTWGHNESGQLGRTPTDAEPACTASVVPGVTGATGINAGRNHSAALTDSGIWTWGGNQYGQLGTTTGNGTNDGVAPARMPNPKGTPSGFTYTSLSTSPVGSHTLAVGSDWDVYAFGANGSGQLGDGTSDGSTSTAAHPDPAMVWRPVGSPVTGVLFGAKPSAAEVQRRADGWHAASPRHRPETVTLTIRSAAGTGQVRPEDAGQSEDTSLQFMYTGDMATLTFTSQHGNAPDPQQVPAGEPTRRPADPSEAGWTFDGWFDGDTAYDFTRPLEHDLTVTGRWHRTGRWVLSPDHGSEYGDDTVTLTAPAAPDIRLASIDTGGTTSLGIGSDGQLYAWGDNTNGQLGDGTTSQHTRPTRVARPDGTGDGFTWTQAAAGRTHGAAVGSDGNLYAWGDNTQGQLGDGTTSQRTRPVKAARPDGTDTGFTWVRAAAGDGYTMALGSDDNLYAWGTLTGGLGDTGRTASSSRPVRVALPQDAPPRSGTSRSSRATRTPRRSDPTGSSTRGDRTPTASSATTTPAHPQPQPTRGSPRATSRPAPEATTRSPSTGRDDSGPGAGSPTAPTPPPPRASGPRARPTRTGSPTPPPDATTAPPPDRTTAPGPGETTPKANSATPPAHRHSPRPYRD